MVINANAKPDGYQVKLIYVRFKLFIENSINKVYPTLFLSLKECQSYSSFSL